MLWMFEPAAPKEEMEAAKEVLGEEYTSFMTELREGLVISRYGWVPNPNWKEGNLGAIGARNINSALQTQGIMDMSWVQTLRGITPPVFREGFQDLPEGAYIVKGETNSVKGMWNTHMYAASKSEIPQRLNATLDALYFNPQGVVVRPFVPFEAWERDFNGCPVTNEWRCFFFNNELLASGYYWANWEEEVAEQGHICAGQPAPPEVLAVAQRAVSMLTTPFVCIDVARVDPSASPDDTWGFEPGSWIVVEVNDGCQSGLTTINPLEFYRALFGAHQKMRS